MAAQIVLSDKELQRRSLCSMYIQRQVDLLEGPAEHTLRWAIRERHFGKIHSPSELREYFINEWGKAWNRPEKDSGYWQGPNAARSFGRRVYEFLLKHEIVHPYEPYTLELDRGTVIGHNALALWRKARQEPVPMVIDFRLRRPRDTRTPYYPALAQWVAARLDVESVDLGIVHVPTIWGDRWTTTDVNEALARRWLNAIVNEAADQTLFPRVGPQCVMCSHPCKEVFHGPNGHSWD